MALLNLPARPPRRTSRRPGIDPARCTGCGRCVAVCEPHVLSLETRDWTKFAVLHAPESCTGCNWCAPACPFGAITMRLVPALPEAGPPPSAP
ncbi:MAG: 4Fe-4S binding protein [Burkholderiales bacterium]|nr:4Fe-4S binding protein [Burkholderiales bacterium]MDE2394656.1 4Fe-4S binding protein [Burkholderiales bacterium]MDE2453669.1 4Fe-4S binding protein [Burkholderiales bacterium]